MEKHENTSNLLNTGGSKRKRGENQSRDWIRSFVEVPKKKRIKKMNLILASLNRGFCSNSEDARLLEPPSCHNALLFLWVSLGRQQEDQVENAW
jgi:hypothetical protein